ncbi:hypothetical protein EHQ59_14520 [Leptospira kemamanensis]|uniref:Uncharacterized protein n=1 Tax=Leptospira kemamanensis TaxID=2484942 RepID=A0A4R9JMF6_9LEPT|nr:hypothetical protein EHQ59_14520 [Leptospira kemamanensis]
MRRQNFLFHSRIFLGILVFFLLIHCQSTLPPKEERSLPNTTITQCPYPISLGTVYGKGITNFDRTILLFQIKQLLFDLCEGHFHHLLPFVDKETGLFVDAKGYWTLDEVKADLSDPNGYFALYYFNSSKLNEKKGSSGNLTVREVFSQAGTVFVDLYVSSSEEVEMKFRFPKDPELERYLINPNFIKIQNTWYLHRMF